MKLLYSGSNVFDCSMLFHRTTAIWMFFSMWKHVKGASCPSSTETKPHTVTAPRTPFCAHTKKHTVVVKEHFAHKCAAISQFLSFAIIWVMSHSRCAIFETLAYKASVSLCHAMPFGIIFYYIVALSSASSRCECLGDVIVCACLVVAFCCSFVRSHARLFGRYISLNRLVSTVKLILFA